MAIHEFIQSVVPEFLKTTEKVWLCVRSGRRFGRYGDGPVPSYWNGLARESGRYSATEAIRGEGGILLNSKGERFMKNYYPERMELGPRDIVARANYNEIISGRGTEHGGVWLDITHLSKEKILDRLPTMYEQFKKLDGIDISKEKMEVGPTAHYSMGGAVVDIKCRTKVRVVCCRRSNKSDSRC